MVLALTIFEILGAFFSMFLATISLFFSNDEFTCTSFKSSTIASMAIVLLFCLLTIYF